MSRRNPLWTTFLLFIARCYRLWTYSVKRHFAHSPETGARSIDTRRFARGRATVPRTFFATALHLDNRPNRQCERGIVDSALARPRNLDDYR